MTLHWRGRGWGPPNDQGNGFFDNWLAFAIIGPSALRRTQVGCSITYANQNVAPENGATGGKPLWLRVLMVPESSDPPAGWPGDPNVGDDVLFEPIVWHTAVYQPVSADMSRPEHLIYHGSLLPGLAISKSQRVYGSGEHGIVHWSIAPTENLSAGSGFDDFNFSLVIRQLWDDDPRT